MDTPIKDFQLCLKHEFMQSKESVLDDKYAVPIRYTD